MSVHTVLEGHQSQIEGIAYWQEKGRLVALLPPLTRSLQDLIARALHLRVGQAVWREVYQQRGVAGYSTSWGKLQTLVERLSPPEKILSASAAEIGRQVEEVNAMAQELGELNRKTQSTLDKWRNERLQETESIRSLLKIPDLFPEEKERQSVTKLLQDITTFLAQPPTAIAKAGLKNQAQRWADLTARFSQTRSQLSFKAIGEKYRLSPETMDLIRQLVAGQTPTLDKVSSQTLTELSHLARFCALVRLSFVP